MKAHLFHSFPLASPTADPHAATSFTTPHLMLGTPKPPARRSSANRPPAMSRPPTMQELDVTEHQSTNNEPNTTRFSPSGLLSSLQGTTPNGGSRSRSRASQPPQISRQATRRRRKGEETSSESESSSGSSDDDNDDDEPSGGLGDLIRSLHDSNETQSVRKRRARQKQGNEDRSDSESVRSRLTGSGSSAGLSRANTGRSERSRSRGGRVGRVQSRESATRGGSGGSGVETPGGGLPTVEERTASLNPTQRPPPPAPSQSFNQHHQANRPTVVHSHQNSFQKWWSPEARNFPPFTTTANPQPGQIPAHSLEPQPTPPLPLPTPSLPQSPPADGSSSPPPLFTSRLSATSTLDPRRHHAAHHQDLNEPFIPEIPHHAQSVPRKVGGWISNYLGTLDPGGNLARMNDEHAGTAPLHTIAALIATTSADFITPLCLTAR